MKILIIRFSSIGDIVLTTPVIRCLKQQLGAEIHYFTKPSFKPILQANPYVDKIHLLPAGRFPFLKDLKKENFDYIIDLHNNLRTRLVKLYLGKKSVSFSKLNFEKFLLVNFKINRLPDIHIVDRYMNTVSQLNVYNDNKGLDYFIPEQSEINIQHLPTSYQAGYDVLVVGASFKTKRLPLHKLKELTDTITKPVIVLGGQEDIEAGEYLEKTFPHKVYNGAGKYSINQSASIVRQAETIYTHDTGLMHIASAFQKNIVSIWGNTVPAFGMYPYNTPFEVIENNHLTCRPCSKIGYNQCPKGHFSCMESLQFDIKK